MEICSADELGQHVASSFSQAPCLFEQDCLYYPDIARGLPMFRIEESTDSSPAAQCSVSVRDSFGEGVYIENNCSDRLCSTDCHCRRLRALDFAFIVSKHSTHTKIEVQNEVLQNTLIDVIGSDERSSQCDPPAWDGTHLFARYEDLEARLRDVIDAPVGSVEAQPFLPLRLLVDGFLGQGLERSPRHKDASYILRDVFPEVHHNSILEAELLEAARKGSIRDIRNLFSHSKFESENAAREASPMIATLGIFPVVQVMEDPVPVAININAHDAHGNTALIHAAFAGHLSIVMYLFCQDADIAWANNEGETALHKAAKAKHIDLICFLIQSGADIHARDNSGATPVHFWSSWAHASSPDLEELILALRERRERNMESMSRWSIVKSWTDQVLERDAIELTFEPTIDDYQIVVSKPDQQLEIKNIKEAKAAVRGFFIQQYYKVRQHEIFERVRGRFPNSTRAWQFGMEALKKISYGYLPHEFGMTMAFLCVCKAVSLTLHTYGYNNSPSDQPPRAYQGEFEESLSHWLPLFHGDDGMLFAETVRSIWNVHLFPCPWLFSRLGHHAMFQYVERLTSDLIDAVERLSSAPAISAKQRTPNQAPQGTNEQQPPPPNDPDPGDPCIGTESTQHNRTAIGRGARSRKSLLWVELMASSIFRILLMFLLWLVSLHLPTGTVRSVAIGAAEWPTDADAQSVARSTQFCFTDLPNAQQPSGILSSAPEQNVIMSGQGYDDRHHGQPPESLALSPSSGGVPGSGHESSGSPHPFACPERNCKKRFTRDYNRNRHLKNHHGPESEKNRLCEACRKEYSARYFRDHRCNPNKPFKRRSRTGN